MRHYYGLRSFPTFDDYLNKWIKPHLLEDLETVFEGARGRWKDKKPTNEPQGLGGGGNFLLATLLFTTFDHLGSFIAWDERGSPQHHENIARVAYCLPSTRDFYALVANLGRNALVHGSWPQSGLLVDAGQWGVGLNFDADDPPGKHNFVYTRVYDDLFPGQAGRTAKVVKLMLNVHALLAELRRWIEHGEEFRTVLPAVYEQVRLRSLNAGVGGPPAGAPSYTHRLCFASTVHWHARRLRRESESLGTWDQVGKLKRRRSVPPTTVGYFDWVRRQTSP